MKKDLVLYTEDSNMYFPDFCDSCYLMPLYRKRNIIDRIYRKIILELQIPLIRNLFSHWIGKVDEVDKIIIFDTGNVANIVKWLRKCYPKKRIILWYWNSIKSTISPDTIKANDIEFWSFDKSDCNKYGLSYNVQFYFPENINRRQNDEQNEQFDVFYVGVDKNRAKILNELKLIFDKNDIRYNFNLVQYNKSTNNFNIEYKKTLIYPEVLKNIHNSKVIIDLVAEWQDGLTLRPLEALFHKKKIITNMKNIVNYDIYNKNNIFILGIDNMNELVDFINSEYDDTNRENLINKYSISGWLANFD